MQTVYEHTEPETKAYNALSGASTNWFSINENIKLVKYSTGITLSSVTGNISNATSYQFLTNMSVDLRPYMLAGYKLTLTDTGAKTMYFTATRVVGTVETTGSALNVSTCVNDAAFPYETFDGASATGFHAINTVLSYGKGGTADELAVTKDALYKIAFNVVLASGTMPTAGLEESLGGSGIPGGAPISSGGNNIYQTCTKSTTAVVDFATVGQSAAEFTVSALGVRQVLIPGPTGGWYGTPTVESGFNYNSATFTVKIERP